MDSTPVGGLSFLPGYDAVSVFNNRKRKKPIGRNTQGGFFLDISALEIETTLLSRNVGNRLTATRSHIA